MKTTAFTQKHIELGAKMVPFAGFNMPIEYVGIKDEHNAVRNNVGVFDVSHMGEFWVKGPNALAFCQYVTSNDVSVLTPGKVQYSCFPNGKGGIVDDLLAHRVPSLWCHLTRRTAAHVRYQQSTNIAASAAELVRRRVRRSCP